MHRRASPTAVFLEIQVNPTAVQAQMVWATTGQGQSAVISPHGQQKLALVKLS